MFTQAKCFATKDTFHISISTMYKQLMPSNTSWPATAKNSHVIEGYVCFCSWTGFNITPQSSFQEIDTHIQHYGHSQIVSSTWQINMAEHFFWLCKYLSCNSSLFNDLRTFLWDSVLRLKLQAAVNRPLYPLAMQPFNENKIFAICQHLGLMAFLTRFEVDLVNQWEVHQSMKM